MKLYQLLGFAGCILLLIASFIPLASVNNSAITLMPVYDNLDLGDKIWVWKDISAFAVTFLLTTLLNFYFIAKKMRIGILISSSLGVATVLFIYFSFWLTQIKANDFTELSFGYSLNGLIILIGYAIVYYAAVKTPKREEYQGSENTQHVHAN